MIYPLGRDQEQPDVDALEPGSSGGTDDHSQHRGRLGSVKAQVEQQRAPSFSTRKLMFELATFTSPGRWEDPVMMLEMLSKIRRAIHALVLSPPPFLSIVRFMFSPSSPDNTRLNSKEQCRQGAYLTHWQSGGSRGLMFKSFFFFIKRMKTHVSEHK